MFVEFKRKITQEYTLMTGLLLLVVSLCVYAASFTISYKEQLYQLRMLATEESEEFFYQINSGQIDSFSDEDLPDSDPAYFNKIFIYAYDNSGKEVFSHNNISWSQEMINSIMTSQTAVYREHNFEFRLLNNRHPKAMLFMRYPLEKNAHYLGEIYVGMDITHWLRDQLRILLCLFFIVLLSMLIVYFLANKMAEKAMVPVVQSFEHQKQFIANASHELRTPLSIVMSGIDVLKSDDDNRLSSFSKGIMADISDEARRMKKLIDELLTAARSDNNALKVRPEVLDLQQIVRQIHSKFLLLAEERHITLQMGDMPTASAYADRTHVQQILTILLDNALKYTPPGGTVVISISRSSQLNMATVQVKDTGCGIAPEDLPHVFERFYRADKARRSSGSGLGLFIAHLLAHKNGGTLTVHSKVGKGSVFSLTLPL